MPSLARVFHGSTYSERTVSYSVLSIVSTLVIGVCIQVQPIGLLLLAAASVGGIAVLLSVTDIRFGFYTIIFIGFILASISRIFGGRLPVTSMLLLLPCLLICLIFFKSARTHDFSWVNKHPLLYIFLFLTAYTIVEIFNPEMGSLLGWLSFFWQQLSYVFLFFISCYLFKGIRQVRFFFKFIVVMLFLTALYGCIQQWFGLASFDFRWVHSDPKIYGLYSLPEGIRKFSTLTDPANFGTLMAGGAVATLVLLIRGSYRRKRSKMLLSFCLLVIVLGMSYSGTRTANIMLFCGVLVYILATLDHKKTFILAIMSAVVFLFVLYAPIYGNVTLNRFRSAFISPTENASMNVRVVHREMMQPYMRRHPFGGGVNTAGSAGAEYNPNHLLAGFPPDGGFFSIALNLGWVGLALQCIYGFFILFYCIHYYYKCNNEEIKTYYLAMGTMLFALFLGAIAQFTLTPIPQSMIVIPFLAIITKLYTFDTSSS